MEICGDITDKDVIASSKELAKLSDILQERSIDDHKKVIVARRKEINEQLERIPIRIDEVHNSMPDISGIDFDKLQDQINELQSIQEGYRKTISRIESGGEIAEKEKQLAKIDTELFELSMKHSKKTQEALQDLLKMRDQLTCEYRKLDTELALKKSSLEVLSRGLTASEDKVENLRKKWHKVNSETFEYSQDDVCPTVWPSYPRAPIRRS